ASALALGVLLRETKACSFTLTYGGVLGRAENRAMVRLLKIPLIPIRRIRLEEFDAVALVDTQPEVGNHALRPELVDGKKMLCIDHHFARPLSKEADYADVGGAFGATCSLLTHYLHAAGVTPDQTLATALFYGVKSDTRDLGREVSADDVWAYSHLVPLCDMPTVSAIEHPRLPRPYFSVLSRAILRAEVTGNVVTCDLGEVYVPDLVAETADSLSRAEGIRWAMVLGEFEGALYLSIRVNDRRYSAGKLVRELIKLYPEGSAGGHGSMAGARIPYGPRVKTDQGKVRARKKLLRTLVLSTGIDADTRSLPLVGHEESSASLESGVRKPEPGRVSEEEGRARSSSGEESNGSSLQPKPDAVAAKSAALKLAPSKGSGLKASGYKHNEAEKRMPIAAPPNHRIKLRQKSDVQVNVGEGRVRQRSET
ncbi:MAG: hypothetical protein AAF550_12495, partial [Myxococcota bacterium]